MIGQGVWVMCFIITSASGDIELVPVEYFGNWQVCDVQKDVVARDSLKKTTCVEQYQYEL